MISPRKLIQFAWVVEVALLIIFTLIFVIRLSTERVGLYLQALPLLTALIGTQGVIAAAGPEVKRLIESRRAEQPGASQGNP